MLFQKLRQLKKEAKAIRLTNDEKKLMQSQMLEFIKSNPVRMEVAARQEVQIVEPFSTFSFSFLKRKYMFTTVAAMVIVMLTGSVSYAAEGSVPGQPLYPIKQINEEVKAAVTVSAKATADWNARRAERRLEEATTLAAQGKLSEKTELELTTKLKAHVKATETEIKKLETNGEVQAAADVSARLNNALVVHGNIISSLEPQAAVTLKEETHYENKQPNPSAVGNVQNTAVKNRLVNEIKIQVSEVTKVKVDLDAKVKTEAQVNAQAAAVGKIGAAKNKIAEVKKFIDLKRASVSSETAAKADAGIKAAELQVVKAEANIKTKAYAEAFAQASRAHELAQEAKFLVNIQTNVKVNLNVGKILNKIEIPKPELKINTVPAVLVPSGSSTASSSASGTGSGSVKVNTPPRKIKPKIKIVPVIKTPSSSVKINTILKTQPVNTSSSVPNTPKTPPVIASGTVKILKVVVPPVSATTSAPSSSSVKIIVPQIKITPTPVPPAPIKVITTTTVKINTSTLTPTPKIFLPPPTIKLPALKTTSTVKPQITTNLKLLP